MFHIHTLKEKCDILIIVENTWITVHLAYFGIYRMEMRPRKEKPAEEEGFMHVPKLSNAEKQKRYRENLKLRPGKDS